MEPTESDDQSSGITGVVGEAAPRPPLYSRMLASSPGFVEYTWSLMRSWADDSDLLQPPPEPKVGDGDLFFQLYMAGVKDSLIR